jgi:hypothetical protein
MRSWRVGGDVDSIESHEIVMSRWIISFTFGFSLSSGEKFKYKFRLMVRGVINPNLL